MMIFLNISVNYLLTLNKKLTNPNKSRINLLKIIHVFYPRVLASIVMSQKLWGNILKISRQTLKNCIKI
jgi:hypothetical protein